MKGIQLLLSGVIILAIFIIVPGFGQSVIAADKVYRLKIQSAYPHGDVSMELLKQFAASAAKRSNDRIRISVFADPELVPAEQLFEATKKGTLDMMHAVGVMWGGIVPVGEIEFGLPMMWNDPGGETVKANSEIVRKFFFQSGFADLLRREYAKQDLYWLDMHSYGRLFTLTTKQFRTCEDIKGKKFRVEGAWMDFYNNLNARGTFISGMEAYMGLKLGTIDASQWDVSGITGLNWHEVAPYNMIPGGNDVIPGQIVVSMKTWKSLPDDLKAALAGAAEDYFHILNDAYMDEMKKVEELVKAGKLINSPLDTRCTEMYTQAAYQLFDEVSERDPAIAEAIKMVRKWRESLK
ncbi:MAG: TRAP transporter substrate-binding protein DctP [Desulfobacteraceae bacterium]|nr:TRAP transporter substrate-binding protein DctP [Desulfobacteraceae bacterium]